MMLVGRGSRITERSSEEQGFERFNFWIDRIPAEPLGWRLLLWWAKATHSQLNKPFSRMRTTTSTRTKSGTYEAKILPLIA